MIEITNYISHLIISLGGLGVFIASLIEEIIIPIPSVLIQSGAGLFLLGGSALTVANVLKLITLVALPAALGVALGSLVIYGIAFYGGDYAIKKYGKYFFINYEKLEKTRVSISSKSSLLTSVTILRFIPLFPNVLITAACGLLKIPLRSYILSTFIGIFIRALYLGALGWLTRRADGALGIDSFFGTIGTLILILGSISIITSASVYLYRRKNK
jgi:membrane protein DedA with SNARE-associated domain